METFKKFLHESRKESDVTNSELQQIYDSFRSIIAKSRRSSKNAAVIWHDVIMKGKGEGWFNENIIPEYIKAGYPEFAKPEYGKWEREMTRKLIRND